MTVGADLNIHLWYDATQDCIKLRLGDGLTSVNADPASLRGHPHLYRRLAAALRDAGKAYPRGVL